jgi:excisionase family DNA binding protein
MTLKKAAKLLGVTPDYLRQQIAAGKLHADKIGRDWNVEPWAVELYRRNHDVHERVTPHQGLTYPIHLSILTQRDEHGGRTSIAATADVSGEGSGSYGAGATVEEAVAALVAAFSRHVQPPLDDIEIPADVKLDPRTWQRDE